MVQKKKVSKVKVKGETKKPPSGELDETELDQATGGAMSSEWNMTTTNPDGTTNTTFNFNSTFWNYSK